MEGASSSRATGGSEQARTLKGKQAHERMNLSHLQGDSGDGTVGKTAKASGKPRGQGGNALTQQARYYCAHKTLKSSSTP
jgi:hypothetical protein